MFRTLKLVPAGVVCVLLLLAGADEANGQVRISQIYGAGGNAGAVFNSDYVELFNAGGAPASIAGFSIQYAATAGVNWSKANITAGVIPPGGYVLLRITAAGANGAAIAPDLDVAGTIAMAAGAGKVALLSNQVTITTGTICPAVAGLLDFVPYGPGTNCPNPTTPNLGAALAAFRAVGGCTDTDNSTSDFTAAAPAPRNSASPLNLCSIPSISISDVSQNEGNFGSSTFAFTVSLSSPAPAGGVTFDISTADSTATVADSDYVQNSLVGQTIAQNGTSYTFNVSVTGDLVPEQDQSFFVNISAVTGASLGDTQGRGTIVNEDGAVITKIHDIQSSGASSPMVGQVATIEGIVIGDFETATRLGGFFVQEEDADADGDPATSEGIFVFNNGPDVVAAGNKVQVTGTVAEAFGQTELTAITNVTVVAASGLAVTHSTITFPVASPTFLERYEGMAIRIDQPLTVSEVFNHARFGELLLSQGGRLATPTNVVLPGAAAAAQQAANNLRKILLDDGSNTQNPDPVQNPEGNLSANNTARVGEIVNNTPAGQNPILGVLGFDFSVYRIQPTGALTFFNPTDNPRPAAPSPVGGRVRVAGANVLNFFTTLDTGSPICGPSGNIDCRGANTAAEFNRQRDKIVNGLLAMDPHVLGINELENNNTVSIQNLVDRLNTVSGVPGKFAFIGGGATIGTDAIRGALIYQPAVVNPVGGPAVLTNAVDARTLDNRSRPPLAQTFERVGTKSSLQRFTVVVNHFKSKGSSCSGDTVGGVLDVDASDGQGECNRTRISVALALIDWLATNPTLDPTPAADRKILIIGDLNSYALEDPIQAMTDPSFTKFGLTGFNANAVFKNLISQYVGTGGYSYVFDGQSGYLDHALANPMLETLVTGVTEFHVNADEPRAIDYNTEFKSAGQITSFYDSNFYRFSDHDPVLVGFNPLCGDLDDDGDVDVADQTLIRSKFGSSGLGANRRFDYDRNGTVNSNDYRIWLNCQRQYAAP